MAATLEIPVGLQAQTLTAKLYADGSDVLVDTVALTEAVNRLGYYSGTITGLTGLHWVRVLSGTNNVWTGWVIAAASGTVIASDERYPQSGDSFAYLGTNLGALDDAVLTQVALVKADTAALLLYPDRTVIRGTVGASPAPTTTSFTPSALSPAGVEADQFKGRIIVFDNATTTTALRGQATDITSSSAAALPAITFTALTTAPVSGDSFSIV